ncbi:hypothetical protein APHAL10511_004087 [Amanita phalloides]|nr:hypothetical protein APHAL10511_004087 [Amanita phalloides]
MQGSKGGSARSQPSGNPAASSSRSLRSSNRPAAGGCLDIQSASMANKLELFVYVIGLGTLPFAVAIEPSKTVDGLQKAILQEKPNVLKGFDADQLILFKVDIDLKGHTKDSLSRLAINEDENLQLLAWDFILEHWPEQPAAKRLQVLVELPDMTDIPRKRGALGSPESILDCFKHAKIMKELPSVTGRSATYERIQEDPSEKILDDRPQPDTDIPPISVIYEGYGHFLDIMDACDNVPGLANIDVQKLQLAVDDLANSMTKYFSHEDVQRDSALPHLNCIFSACTGTPIPELRASMIGSTRMDGHNIVIHGGATMVVEFKNWTTGNSSLPEIEMLCYVAHQLASEKMGNEVHKNLYIGWRVPGIGLTIVGCDIKFYAIVMIDHHFRLVPLTQGLSFMQCATEGRDRRLLYSAFTAASVLQAHIIEDARRLRDNPPAVIPVNARLLPAVSKLRKYRPTQAARQSSNLVAGGSSNDYFDFEILTFFPNRRPNRFLYIAKALTNKEIVLIKFSQRYSIELHEHCLNSGHAPQIFAFERLPGGVAMEYIQSGVPITGSSHSPKNQQRWIAELEGLVADFHGKDLVHGDLRDSNIMCEGDSMMLLDFDWAGKDGEVFYPTGNLNDELLQGRVSKDLRITKEDDRRVLKITLDKTRRVIQVSE